MELLLGVVGYSVFAFLDTIPTTVYYNIKYNKLKT